MTLIEILVAIVVLSIGLLGLAGLQLKGLQVNQGSVYRWQAAMLAQDIADRMRADSASAKSGLYTLNGAPPTTGPAGTLAAIQDWWVGLQALPGASAVIANPIPVPGTNNQSILITVSWLDTRAQGGAGVSTTNSAYATPASYSTTVEFCTGASPC
jgi:type IV pilus assembly protein PilV